MASAEEAGQVEVKFSDRAEANPVTVASVHTSYCSGASKTFPTGATAEALPNIGQVAVKNVMTKGRIVIYFTSDATDIAESEESGLQLPIVLYNEKTMQAVTNKLLTFDNMTGFTTAGTVDFTCTATIPQRLCYYDIPNGFVAGLGSGKFHCYIGDDTA